MARSVYGGEITHLVVVEDPGNGDALVLAPANTVVPLRASPGGAIQNDYLLWDGSAYTITASSIVTDARGHLPLFQGPDGVAPLYDAGGYALMPRGGTGTGGTATWDSLSGKPAFVAAGTSAAAARDVIDAASSVEMTVTEAQTGTGTTGYIIDAATLKAAINRHAPANHYDMPVWDGTGTHPVRPTLPAGFVVTWWQPTMPLVGGNYAVAGVDKWEATAA
jgi:hypothetical protein